MNFGNQYKIAGYGLTIPLAAYALITCYTAYLKVYLSYGVYGCSITLEKDNTKKL